MKTLLDYLEQLGLSEIEAKLYLKLLEDGSIGVRELAKRVGINRTSAYLYIDQLIEKGVIIKIVKGTRNQVAANPLKETLPQLLERKAQTVKTLQNELSNMMKIVTTPIAQGKGVEETEIRYYKGINAVRKIYQEALKANELRSYVKVGEATKIFSDNVALFNEAFKQNPNLTIKEIVYETPFAKEQSLKILSKNNRYFYKMMPKDLELTSEDILIYDGKVAIINYTGKVTSVVLHSRDYYNNSIELFDFIWKIIR